MSLRLLVLKQRFGDSSKCGGKTEFFEGKLSFICDEDDF